MGLHHHACVVARLPAPVSPVVLLSESSLASPRLVLRLMACRLYNQKQEVLAIALCNSISGLAGGIPATAALARTALNIKSGATSRAAGIVNGIMIIILSTVLFNAFKYLPLPVVAAILVNVAVRMVEWPEVRLL